METCAEDLTVTRSAVAAEDDDDDHEDHDDNDKINDTEGVDPERLKAFNVRAALTSARHDRTHTHTHCALHILELLSPFHDLHLRNTGKSK